MGLMKRYFAVTIVLLLCSNAGFAQILASQKVLNGPAAKSVSTLNPVKKGSLIRKVNCQKKKTVHIQKTIVSKDHK
jgi:hypothetical protein